MANEKNLKPIKTLSKEEAKKRGSKGGKKSGEVRRQKRLLKDCMIELLELPVTDTKSWNKLSKLGIDIEKIDNRALLVASLFKKAVDFGDVQAFKEIKNLIGEDGEESKNEDKIADKLKEVFSNVDE